MQNKPKDDSLTMYEVAVGMEPELQYQGFETVRRLVKGAANDLEMCSKIGNILDLRKEMIITLSRIVEKQFARNGYLGFDDDAL